MGDTIAAIATGSQVSAIGIVRLSGPDSIGICDRLFAPFDGKPVSEHKSRMLIFGNLLTAKGELLDVCLCTISRGPNSYTGEDTAELQCHGSPVVLRAALDEIFSLGARQAGPGEFTKRAFINGRMDLTSAEAVIDLIDAETRESALNAAGQLSGAIFNRIDRVYSDLTDISSHFHAVLDYPDEDIEDFKITEYSDMLRGHITMLSRLLATFERGKVMNSGIPAVIIGKPNAGKSSLLNALLGYDRAIVTRVPGTTRDTIEEKIKIGGTLLRLIDTAGIRDTEDEVEKIGVERSRAALKNAELVLAVIDGSDGDGIDDEIIKSAEAAKKAVLIISKQDLGCGISIESRLPAVHISAVTGEGIDELERVIGELFPAVSAPVGEILTNSRHADSVSRALEYLNAAVEALEYGMTPDIVLTETEGAMTVLGELTGRTVREDITNRIFQRFCVGK